MKLWEKIMVMWEWKGKDVYLTHYPEYPGTEHSRILSLLMVGQNRRESFSRFFPQKLFLYDTVSNLIMGV